MATVESVETRSLSAGRTLNVEEAAACRSLWVGMLRIYAIFLERGLLKEFSHTPRVLDGWTHSLSELEASASGWVHWCTDALEEDNLVISFFSDRVGLAIQVLRQEPTPEFTPVALAYQGLGYLSQARRALSNALRKWRRWVSFDCGPNLSGWALESLPENIYPARDEVSDSVGVALAEFRNAIAEDDDFELCRASRRLCHALLFLLTLHSRAWKPELHQNIVWLYLRALERMQPGKLRQAVQSRLDYLLELSAPPHKDLGGYFKKSRDFEDDRDIEG